MTIDPRSSEKTIYESVFVFLSYSAAFFGIWLSYRGIQVTYDKVKANRYLIFGIGLSVTGVLGLYLILNLKYAILG